MKLEVLSGGVCKLFLLRSAKNAMQIVLFFQFLMSATKNTQTQKEFKTLSNLNLALSPIDL